MPHRFQHMFELEEFESRGFIQHSGNVNLLRRLRVQYGEYFRMFKSGTRGCGCCPSSRHGSWNIFGHHLYYYYDIRKKEDFVKFLTEKFYNKNPLPDTNIRREFTRLLHYHGLHWEECYCLEK